MAAEEERTVPGEAGAAEPTYSEDAVDLTLIRWMLSLTAEERLIILQENIRATMQLCDGLRVPESPRLIHIKGETARETDEYKLAILRRTLEEKSRR